MQYLRAESDENKVGVKKGTILVIGRAKLGEKKGLELELWSLRDGEKYIVRYGYICWLHREWEVLDYIGDGMHDEYSVPVGLD